METERLLSQHPIITDQIDTLELRVLLQELEAVLIKNIPGDIVEFGCYAGTSSLFIQRMLLAYNSKKVFHVYDSFEGLPSKQRIDESPAGMQFKEGELAFSKSDFIKNFKKANLPLPKIHKGWFEEVDENVVPKQIAFAFLDGDYYQSIKNPLKLIWGRLSPSAIVTVDDYQNEALPGAAKAVDEWIANRTVTKFRTQSSLAIITV